MCEFSALNFLRDELGIKLEKYIYLSFYMQVVSSSKRLDQLEYLDSLNLNIPENEYNKYFFKSLTSGSLDTVRWFSNKITDRKFSDPLRYYYNIQLDIISFIFKEIPQLTSTYNRNQLVEDILVEEKFEILEYLINNNYIIHGDQVSISIPKLSLRGAPNAIKWVYKNYNLFYTVHCDQYSIDNACDCKISANDRMELVKWLHENTDGGCTTQAMDNAAQHDLQLVIWLHENRTEGCTTDAMDLAFRNGHLDIVKWLHANRTEGCSDIALEAILYCGNIEMLKWLLVNYPNGVCPDGSEFTMSPHLYSCVDSVEMLKCIETIYREPIDNDPFSRLCSTGNMELIRYIVEEHQPTRSIMDGNWTDVLPQSLYGDNIDVVKYLFEKAPPKYREYPLFSDLPRLISTNVTDEIIQFLINKEICTWDIRGLVKAIKLGRFKMVQWLYENCPQSINVKEEIGELLISSHKLCNTTCMCLPYILRFEESIPKFQ